MVAENEPQPKTRRKRAASGEGPQLLSEVLDGMGATGQNVANARTKLQSVVDGKCTTTPAPIVKRIANTQPLDIDFRGSKPVPSWVQEIIETHLAIEEEDVKSANALGFMARALVIATMPYKDPKVDVFKRKNGDFNLRIVAGYEGGIPFGIYPRLLMSWITTEAVRKQSPVIELGDSLRVFLRDVLDLRSTGAGKRGASTRVSEQMKRLFGSLITAQYTGSLENRGFRLRNVLIAEDLELDHDEMAQMDGDDESPNKLWTPQERHEAGTWQSKVTLSNKFFKECVTTPVPIDLRAYKGLREAGPLAMDIYTWLSYRMSYTQQRSRPIRWEALMMQFGSGAGNVASSEAAMRQAVLDFKRGFLKSLQAVKVVYPQARLDVTDQGLVLLPSPSHVVSAPGQGNLFD